MKKIGFIDLFIDEWHANKYPGWFRTAPNAAEFEMGYAWEEKTLPGGLPLAQWCEKQGMIPARSMEEVVEKSDCICVLAPSNPEVHERLADLALRSGKPVYIDKPFTNSRTAAERIFALAEKYNTPLMSSSALRFSDELISGKLQEITPEILCTTGGGTSWDEYGIHQLEMIVSVMGSAVRNMKFSGDKNKLSLVLEYEDSRIAQVAYSSGMPFTITGANHEASVNFTTADHIFENLIAEILKFFMTGKSVIPQEQTVGIAALLEKSIAMLHGI